jgi:acetolactate synthase small subunit
MSPEEVEKKALWLMEPVLGKQNVDQIIELIRDIERVPAVRDLTKRLTVT